jgi:Spy/CpxP family protein refolding chaperone
MKSNNKILSVAVVLLLLTNITLVILMVKNKGQNDGRRFGGKGDPFETMAKELNMTAEQRKSHQQFRDDFFKTVKPLWDSVRTAKSAFFELAKDPAVNDSVLNVHNKHISEIQLTIDKLTFEHFRRARALYTGEQQKKYDDMVQKMMQRQGGRGGWKKDSTGKNK